MDPDKLEFATLRIISGGHFANTTVMVDDKPLDNVCGIEWSLVNGVSTARITVELVEVDTLVHRHFTVPTLEIDGRQIEQALTRFNKARGVS